MCRLVSCFKPRRQGCLGYVDHGWLATEGELRKTMLLSLK